MFRRAPPPLPVVGASGELHPGLERVIGGDAVLAQYVQANTPGGYAISFFKFYTFKFQSFFILQMFCTVRVVERIRI